MAKSKTQTKAKRAVKKAAKRNPKAFIFAVIAVVLIVAIAVAVLYFAFPETWDYIVDAISSAGSGDNGNGGNVTPPDSGLVFSEGELNVYFVDVDQGDCIIIRFPDGKTMMIDGGDKGYRDEVLAAMDSLNLTTLDWVLLTHTDADHCGSLNDAIEHAAQVKTVYLPKIKSNDYDLGLSSDYKTKTTAVYNDFVKAASEATYKNSANEDVSASLVFTEDVLVLENEEKTYKFTMYCRDDAYYKAMKINDAHDINDVSPICVLEFNGRKLVFTGDANKSSDSSSSEKNFLDKMAALGYTDESFDADVLKVPHHGGSESTGADFLDFIDVEYAVVCVGGEYNTEDETPYNLFINETLAAATDFTVYGNKAYGHPTSEVCCENGRLDQAGVKEVYYTWWNDDVICRVDASGAISFSCDKQATRNGNAVTFEAAA